MQLCSLDLVSKYHRLTNSSISFLLDQLRPFLDESASSFVERLFEALEESRNSRGNKGSGEKNRKRELKVEI